MARLRMTGVPDDNLIPTPPTDKATLFYNSTERVYKGKFDDGSVVPLGVSQSFIEQVAIDAVGQALVDSNTITFNYDSLTQEITASVSLASINSTHVDQISPVKIGDNYNKRLQDGAVTTGATPVTILSLDCLNEGVWLVEYFASCFRVGGSQGSPGDSGAFKRTFRIKSIGGTVSVLDFQSSFTSRDNSQYNVSANVVGQFVEFRIRGAANQDLRWRVEVDIKNNN